MASLASRLGDLITAIGADIKDLVTRVTALEGGGGGGGDGWTYVKLTTDFNNSTTTESASPLTFTPDASSHYEFEARLYVRSAATTTGVQVGIDWPSSGNIVENHGVIQTGSSGTAITTRVFGDVVTQYAAATGIRAANTTEWCEVKGTMVTNGTTPTALTLVLKSEIASSQVTIRANSWIRYRKLAI